MERDNHRISMRTDLEVLNSVDLNITTSTSDGEYVRLSERERIRE